MRSHTRRFAAKLGTLLQQPRPQEARGSSRAGQEPEKRPDLLARAHRLGHQAKPAVLQRKLQPSDLLIVHNKVALWASQLGVSEQIANRAVQILDKKYDNLEAAESVNAIQDALSQALLWWRTQKELVIKPHGESFTAVLDDERVGELDLYFDGVFWLGFVEVDKDLQGLGIGSRLVQAAVDKIGHLYVSTAGQSETEEKSDSDDIRWLTKEGAALVGSCLKAGILDPSRCLNPFTERKHIKQGDVEAAEEVDFTHQVEDSMDESTDETWPEVPEGLTAIQIYHRTAAEAKVEFVGLGLYSGVEEPRELGFKNPVLFESLEALVLQVQQHYDNVEKGKIQTYDVTQ